MNSILDRVAGLVVSGMSNIDIATEIGVTTRTVSNYRKRIRESDDYPTVAAYEQKSRDVSNKRRKTIREDARVYNVQTSIADELKSLLSNHSFHPIKHKAAKPDLDRAVGVIQVSDVHFNELIDDVDGNKFDFDVASRRLHKLADQATKQFKAHGITNVAVFFTGDLLNSDRRLDEITSAATNRSNAIFLAVDILQQMINDLLCNFDTVTIASVTGNESRVGADNHWSDFLAGDSYDIVIHNMLSLLFANEPRVKVVPISDPMECVVKVLNTHFLLVHGHGHRGLANTSNIENEVLKIKAGYAARGVLVDYVICGHIHSAYVSDLFSRSSGLPGTNSYARKALNLHGKSSQNIYVVHADGSIDSTKVCLQQYKDFSPYEYDRSIESYNQRSAVKTITIQSVLI